MPDETRSKNRKRGNRDPFDAEGRQNVIDVMHERLIGNDHENLVRPKSLWIAESQERDAMKSDRCLPATSASLDDDEASFFARDELKLSLIQHRRDRGEMLVFAKLPVCAHAQPGVFGVPGSGRPNFLRFEPRSPVGYALPASIATSHKRSLRTRDAHELPADDADSTPRNNPPVDGAVPHRFFV
jgi:hypothetical protein